jgi:hypothetical protein
LKVNQCILLSFFDPEDGGDIFFWNTGWLSMALYPSRWYSSINSSFLKTSKDYWRHLFSVIIKQFPTTQIYRPTYILCVFKIQLTVPLEARIIIQPSAYCLYLAGFLFGLLFNPEVEGDILLWNISFHRDIRHYIYEFLIDYPLCGLDTDFCFYFSFNYYILE